MRKQPVPHRTLTYEAKMLTDFMLTYTERDMKDGTSSQPFEGKKFNEIVDKVVDERLNLNETLKEQLATMVSQYFSDLTRQNKGELPNNFLDDFSHIAYLDGPGNEAAKIACLFLSDPAFGEPYRKLINIRGQELESVYSDAYALYQTNHFEEACNQFANLCILAPKDARFLLGLGACCQNLNFFSLAKIAYSKAEEVDPSNPTPAWHRYFCEKMLEEWKKARASLRQVMQLGLSKPEYLHLAKAAAEELKELEKEHPGE